MRSESEDHPLREKMTREMFKHLKAHLPEEFQNKLTNEQLTKEVLYCLSSYVLIEKRRALIQFTNRVANAKNNDKPSEEPYCRDDAKTAEFMDDLKELG